MMTMNGKPYKHVWAVASGRSLDAICALWLDEPVKDTPEHVHENLRIIGMAGPGAIQVGQDQAGNIVAEMIRNEIFPDPVDPDIFYIKIPVDYKNAVIIPPDALGIPASKVAARLSARGWGDVEPLTGIFAARAQIAVPDDYTPPPPPAPAPRP